MTMPEKAAHPNARPERSEDPLRETVPIATVVVINGPPGIGKSTLARRLHSDRPLALVVDFDELRLAISHWQEYEEATSLASALGFALARTHLSNGSDVVIAAFSVRASFFSKLDALANDITFDMYEILLSAADECVVERFRRRRAERANQGVPDPARDIAVDDVDSVIRWASSELQAVASQRTHTKVVLADGDLEETHRRVQGFLGAPQAGRRD